MEYLIPALLLLLIVGGAVTFFVLMVTRKRDPNAQDGGTPSVGRDSTPLGDTSQHAGEQSEDGETVSPSDARGGAGGTYASTGAPGSRRGDERDERDEPPTESERLANREP